MILRHTSSLPVRDCLDGLHFVPQASLMFKIIGADGREYGPVDAAQLRAWIAEGRVDGQTLAQAEGAAEWKPLSAHSQFSFVAAVPPPLSGAPGTTPHPLKTNGFAIAGMVMGILSVTLCFCCYGFPCNVLGLIFSLVALSQIKNNPHLYAGRGLAIAGLVLSIVSFALVLCLILTGTALDLTRWERIRRELDLH